MSSTTLQRRDFFARLAKNNAPGQDPVTGNPDPLPTDENFRKYANKTVPFQIARTQAGINPYTETLSEDDVLHLLRRTTFGAPKAAVDQLKTMTLTQAVDYLIDNPVMPTSLPLNNYQNSYADPQGVPFGSPWVDFVAPDAADGTLNSYRTGYSFKPWWMAQMMFQQTHILEKMVLFWHNHFSTQTGVTNAPKAVWGHFKMLRTNALGNFRTMVKQVTVDPHMLIYLNGNSNSKSAPDENYGRELQELFMVGKGPDSHYTEDDVKAAAKVLTGWRRTLNATDGSYSYTFNSSVHDTTNKQFSAFYNNTVITGQTGAAGANETDALIGMILNTTECAKYIVRCLYRWFIYYVIDDTTEANVITPLADIFRNGNYEIAPVLKALFKSEHFFDPVNRGCIIKSPVDLYVTLVREFNLQMPTSPVDVQYAYWKYMSDRAAVEAQNIGDPPNVSGWLAYYHEPQYYEAWISSATIQVKESNLNNFTKSGVSTGGNSFKMKVDSMAFIKQFPNPEDPNAVVANFIKYLLPQDLSASQKTYLKSILLSNQVTDSYWTTAWQAYAASPNDSTLLGTVKSRLDTLINYMVSLEEYLLY